MSTVLARADYEHIFSRTFRRVIESGINPISIELFSASWYWGETVRILASTDRVKGILTKTRV